MPASNETQRPNVLTGSDHCTTTEAVQALDTQINYDDDDGDDDRNILP